MPEILDKAYDAELSCSVGAARTYGATGSIEDLRAAILAKLKLSLLLSWTAETDARRGDVADAQEVWLDALDLARFAYDVTEGDSELTGMRAAAGTVSEEIAADFEELRRANPSITPDSADDEVENGARVVRTQAETAAVEAALDSWEARSRQKTFDGADVVETVDGSTTIEIRTNRDAWLKRTTDERRQTLNIIANIASSAVALGPLGYILKLVDSQGQTLFAGRMPQSLTSARV
jgi:hypothetical protein